MGPLELLVVLVLILLFFDPAKLPEIARNLGKMVRQLRQVASDLSQTLDEKEVSPENKVAGKESQKALFPGDKKKENGP